MRLQLHIMYYNSFCGQFISFFSLFLLIYAVCHLFGHYFANNVSLFFLHTKLLMLCFMDLMLKRWKTCTYTNEHTTNKSQNYDHNCAVSMWLKVRFGWLFFTTVLLATLFRLCVFLCADYFILHTIFYAVHIVCVCVRLNGIVNYRRCFTIKINRVWTILEASISGQQIFIVSFLLHTYCRCCCCWTSWVLLCHFVSLLTRSKLWQVMTMNRIYCR